MAEYEYDKPEYGCIKCIAYDCKWYGVIDTDYSSYSVYGCRYRLVDTDNDKPCEIEK